jgi:outer membrane protein insertion porin family
MKRTLAWILSVVVVGAMAATLRAAEFPVVISGVKVEGNKEIRAEEILKVVKLKAGQQVAEEDLKKAAQAVFDLGWFSEVLPEVDATGTVLFRVVENPVVEKIEITGNVNKEAFELFGITLFRAQIMSTDRARSILRDNDVKVRKVLNNVSLKKGLQAVIDAYEEKGYALIMIGRVNLGKVLSVEIIEGRITDNAITGLVTVPESVARRMIDLPVGECVKKTKIQEVLARLYASVYFSKVEVVPQQGATPDAIQLVWTLTERALIASPTEIGAIDLDGGTLFPSDIARASVGKLPPGPLTNYQLLEALEGLFDLYYRNGYVMVRFSVLGTDAGRLRLSVEEGRIGEIALQGNDFTKDFVLQKNLGLKEGEVLNRLRLATARQGLMALGYFDSVDFVPEWVGDQVNVSVSIVENRKLGGVNGSIAYSPESGGLVGKLDYTQKNLFGTGQDLSFSYSRGLLEDTSAVWDLGYSTVAFFPGFSRVGFDLYRKSETGTVDDEEETFYTVGGMGSVSYPCADYTNLALSYKHEAVRVGDEGPWDPVDSVIVALRYDDVNNPRFPTAGSRRSVSLEKAGGFASGPEFTKLGAHWIYFSPVRLDLPFLAGRDQVAAARLSLGWGEGLPSSQLYDFGGPTTIRGVEASSVARLAYVNLEYRVAIVEGLTAVLFFDGGVDLDRVNSGGTKSALGLELGIEAAGMYVRLDMSWRLDEEFTLVPRFDFGFSPMF